MRRVLPFVALICAFPARAVTIDWVVVGNPGNAPDTATNCSVPNCGAVEYTYSISKYEITNTQYAEFLNEKADSDPLRLYDSGMSADAINGGITRSGVSGSYAYTVKAGFENRPVTYVSFYDALRFANWLSNGQGNADTESGSYTLLGGTEFPTNGNAVMRDIDPGIFLPRENEWYKAAYFDAFSATYFDYPAGSNSITSCGAPTSGANSANCEQYVGGHLTDVGAYSGSPSPNGTFDQGGNAMEWIEELVPDIHRRIRGGAFDLEAYRLAASWSYFDSPANNSFRQGFRVVSSVPEPGTGVLVMTGLLGLTMRRSRGHGRVVAKWYRLAVTPWPGQNEPVRGGASGQDVAFA